MPFVSNVAVGIGGIAGYKALDKLDKMAAEAKDAAGKRLGDARAVDPAESFLDVYVLGNGGWRAARIAPGYTDFTGLGERLQATGRANLSVLVTMLEGEFAASVDERIKKVTYKPAIVSGVALNQLLRSISEPLAALPLIDIGAKLAFLTSKGR
jgi:hypothetical protein